jgi:WD40 repeat protein
VATIYSLKSGETLYQIDGLATSETAVAFSPDGLGMVTFDRQDAQQRITDRRAVHTRRIETGRKMRQSLVAFDRRLGPSTLQFSPDGETLVLSVQPSSQDAEPVLVDWSRGEVKDITLESLKQYGQNLRSPLIDPSGLKLAGYTENVVMIWDPSTGKLLGKIAERSSVQRIRWNPKGDSLLTVTTQGVRVWDVQKLRPERVIPNTGGNFVSLAHDGKWLVTSNEGVGVRVAELNSGRDVFVLTGNSNGAHDAVFSPKGDLLATGGVSWTDTALTNLAGDVRFWTLDHNREAKETQQIWSGGLVGDVVISQDGQRMAWRTWGQGGPAVPETGTKLDHSQRVVLVDVTRKQIIKEIPSETAFAAIVFSADGKTLFVAAGTEVRRYDAGNGEPVTAAIEMLAGDDTKPFQTPQTLGLLADPSKLVVYYRSSICINDIASGKIVSTIRVNVDRIAPGGHLLHPSGNRVFVACHDGAIRVFSPELGKTLLELKGHEKPVTFLQLTPDGNQLVSTSYDHTVRVWDGSPL